LTCTRSGETRNSGAPGQISQVEPSLPFLYPPFLFSTLPPFSLPSFRFHALPTHSRPSLPFPSSPPYYSQPFPSPFLPPLPLITARDLGSAIAPPAGPGRARPPNAFLCNSQPKICKSLKVSPAQDPPHNILNSCEL